MGLRSENQLAKAASSERALEDSAVVDLGKAQDVVATTTREEDTLGETGLGLEPQLEEVPL